MQALRRVLTGAAVLLMLALLAAWQVPPRLEWGRYRGSIAAFASARLARGVTIGGQVSLSLLPQVVLTASEVKLADRGDGISARVGALRLQVQFWPLLRGHVVPRDLLLADPVVTVPWPLPDTAGAVPALAPGFAAGTEGGALHLGALTLTAVSASLHADPDTGAFGAQGTVSVQGRPCRFTALIGAAGRDGIAPLNLTLDGQGALQGTGGSFRGRLLGHGALQGTLQARGPDASKLLPAPAVPWRVQGAVQVSGGQLQAPDLQLMLADSPGQARVTLRMLPPARLDAAAKLGQFALGGWIAGLARPGLPIPVHLDVRAQAATWRGRALRDIALQLDLGGAEPGLVADATLPGDAKLHLSASLQESTTGAVLAGPLTLSAPDLPTTLTWLATKPGGAPPDWAPLLAPRADLQARLRLAGPRLELAGLALKLGASTVTGDAALTLAARPSVRAALTVDHLAIAPPLSWPPPEAARLAAALALIDADLDLHANALDIPGLPVSHVEIQARTGANGVALRHLAGDLPGLHIEAGASIAPDFSLASAHLDINSPNTEALPPAWRVPAGLWQGPFHLALTANGPPRQIATQLRADLGDLRAEAEGHIDSTEPRLTATVTLRHPGAPRLLAALGLPDAQRGLDTGSLAFQAHLVAWPGHARADDFSLAAAALHIGGRIDADFSGPRPTLNGRIDAPNLTLPRFDALSQSPLPLATLASWQGQIHVHAAEVLWGASTVATETSADFSAGGGVATAYISDARIAGGHLAGSAVIDQTGPAPSLALRADLTGATPDDLPVLPPLAFAGGTIDLGADVSASGYSPAALLATASGEIHARLHDTALAGVDLPQLTRLLAARAPGLRPALTAAMGAGNTGPLSGDISASLQQGAATLPRAHVAGGAGSLAIEGSIDLPGRTSDLALQVAPAVTDPPALGLRLVGPGKVASG